jgi:uncharacterized protein (TIGR02246 family)
MGRGIRGPSSLARGGCRNYALEAALYSRGDYKGVAKLYAPDADRGISGSTEIARGRFAIEQMYQRELTGWDGSRVHDSIRVRFLRPDVALLDGFGPDSGAKDSPVAIYTVVLTKQDSRWMIAAGRPRGVVAPESP